MKRRHTPGQVIGKPREADAELAAGRSIAEVFQKLELVRRHARRGCRRIRALLRGERRRLNRKRVYRLRGFQGRLRDELLNLEEFTSVREAKMLAETWRRDYNHCRPHSGLGYRTAARFAAACAAAGSSPFRLPQHAHQGRLTLISTGT